MNIKLAIALFACTIIVNPSVFAMDPDTEEHISVPPKKPVRNPWGSDNFLKSVHEGIVAGFWTDPNIYRGNESEPPAKE